MGGRDLGHNRSISEGALSSQVCKAGGRHIPTGAAKLRQRREVKDDQTFEIKFILNTWHQSPSNEG